MAFRLAAATFADALEAGIRYNFIDCDESLVPFYTRLGYRAVGTIRYRFPEYGEGVVMVLDLYDEARLYMLRSPFLKHYRTWAYSQPALAA